MGEYITEQDIIKAFEAADLNPADFTETEKFKDAFIQALTDNLVASIAGKIGQGIAENTDELRARLMAEAKAVGADKNPTTLLQIAFAKQAELAIEPEIPSDISGITNPAELLNIGFAKQKRGQK